MPYQNACGYTKHFLKRNSRRELNGTETKESKWIEWFDRLSSAFYDYPIKTLLYITSGDNGVLDIQFMSVNYQRFSQKQEERRTIDNFFFIIFLYFPWNSISILLHSIFEQTRGKKTQMENAEKQS